jgi:hypothetical protein
MPEEIVSGVLRLVGYRAYGWDFQEETSSLTIWVRQAASRPLYTCSGCGIGTERVHSVRERRVRDLPWGTWKVTLALEVHRVYCRRCGVRGERMEFLEGKHPYTRRFAAAVARDLGGHIKSGHRGTVQNRPSDGRSSRDGLRFTAPRPPGASRGGPWCATTAGRT